MHFAALLERLIDDQEVNDERLEDVQVVGQFSLNLVHHVVAHLHIA
jgi:hypothetical protein